MADNNKHNPSTLNPNSIYKLDNNPSICFSPPCSNIPNTVQEYGNVIPSILDIATYVSPTSPTYRSFSPTAQAQGRTQQRIAQQMQTQTQAANPTIPLQSQGNQTADNLAVREIQNIDATQPYNPETLPTPAMINAADARAAANPANPTSLLTDISNPYEITAESVQYLNGFIRTQVGRRVSIDFLVGSNTIVTKSGYLLGVAANYILINELDTNDLTTCDFYNIKFIRFYFD
ncbi:MAG: hypothetical protein ACI4HK_06125 [Ruminococcus sp.]